MDININFNVDKWGINEDNFKNLELYIRVGYEKGLQKLMQNTQLKLTEQMSIRGLSGSEYAGSVTIEPNGFDGFTIRALGHMLYVEFGTGIVGDGTHPNTSLSPDFIGWDINNHGELGWWFEKDGRWYWTKGQEARPVIYETWKYVRFAYHSTISSAIEKELRKMGG